MYQIYNNQALNMSVTYRHLKREDRIQKVGFVKLATSRRHSTVYIKRRRDRDLKKNKSCRSFLQSKSLCCHGYFSTRRCVVWGIGNQCFMCSEIIFIYFS